MEDIPEISTLLSVLSENLPEIKVGAVSEVDLLQVLSALSATDAHRLLEHLWSSGAIFVSGLAFGDGRYRPAAGCRCSFTAQENYYGNDALLGTYQVNSTKTGSKSLHLLATLRLPYPLFSAACDPSHDQLVVGDQRGSIYDFNISTLEQVASWATSFGRTWSLAFSSNGENIISGHQSGTVAIWDRNGHQNAHVASGNWVRSIAVTYDGRSFLTAHSAGTSTLWRWSLFPLGVKDEYTAYESAIWAVRCLPDGTGFVCGGRDAVLTCHRFASGGSPDFISRKLKGPVSGIAVHPSSLYAVTGSWTGSIRFWRLSDGKDVNSIEAHSSRITGLDLAPNGDLLVSADKNGELAVWQAPSGVALAHIRGHSGWIRDVHFWDNERIVTVSSDGLCKIWLIQSTLATTGGPTNSSGTWREWNELEHIDSADDE